MKTLALRDGDLVLHRGEGYATVSGAGKVQQELALALGERFGTDRFHADVWGSTLQDFIGNVDIQGGLEFDVRNEVARVITQYIAIQDNEVYQSYVNGTRSRLAAADIVRRIGDIQVLVIQTTIYLSVSLSTLAGETVTLNRTVTL